MLNRNSQIKNRSSTGFTLVELLIVIGIIALLISILLPVVGRMRIQGQRVATQNTINRLVQACEAYYSDFNSYPGPFADYQMVPLAVAATTPPQYPFAAFDLQVILSGTTTAVPLTKGVASVTSSENLFAGLCGGLKFTYNAGAINGFVYDQDAAKKAAGPRWLNVNQAKKSQAYMEISAPDFSADSLTNNAQQTNPTGLWWKTAGAIKGDSELYEFVDRFRIPQPILYLRAHRGADPIIGVDNNSDAALTTADYPAAVLTAYPNFVTQFDTTQITTAYPSAVATGMAPWHASSTDYQKVADSGGNTILAAGDESYFGNAELSTYDAVKGIAKQVAQHKDGFILISAGPDGIYGTADDIRN